MTDWFNFLLLALYLHAIGLLGLYLIRSARMEWHTPHVALAFALLIWVTGMTVLRVSSIFRVFSDRSCSAANLTTCIGGGATDVLVYNIGVGLNAFGLLCVLRVIASMQGEYAWIQVVIQSAVLASIAVVISTFGLT